MSSEPNFKSELTIRAATEADIDVLGQYGALLISMHHDWDRFRFIPASSHTPVMYASYLKSQLDRPEVLVLVAELDGAVVGYAFAGIEGPDYMSLRGPAGVIHDIYVDDAYRRRGAGRALLTAAVDELSGRGATQIVLSTAHRNAAAQHMFTAAGFEATMVEMTLQLNGG
ncbi:N-acetyltransferase family protein [Rhizobium sp. 2YAF20]|uniref:GNAT family N-acetyltransferase n=1 Tax=Rhizobium sp. 2YAF20 TaxID=3233027 RepID=UPI003F96018D